MGSFSIWHWLIVGILLLLLFGKGRFSDMMGDVAKGIKSFKKGMSEDDDAPHGVHGAMPPAAPRQIDAPRPTETIVPHADPVDPLAKPADRGAGSDGRSL